MDLIETTEKTQDRKEGNYVAIKVEDGKRRPQAKESQPPGEGARESRGVSREPPEGPGPSTHLQYFAIATARNKHSERREILWWGPGSSPLPVI